MSHLSQQHKDDSRIHKHNFWLDRLYLRLYRRGHHLYLSLRENRSLINRIKMKLLRSVYNILSHSYGCFVPFSAKIGSRVEFRHSFHGIFISQLAEIGDDVVIMHHVTIGSNTDKDNNVGAPVIGNNVFIGAGACLIGNIRIGDYAKIGANATVVNDIPESATVVGPKAKILTRKEELPEYVENTETD